MEEKLIIRALIQRVSSCEVIINNETRGKMSQGLLVLLGFGFNDSISENQTQDINAAELQKKYSTVIEKSIDKIIGLRIFTDASEKLNLSLKQVDGSLYCVSQFSLFADCSKGQRPSFTKSAKPNIAKELYHLYLEMLMKKISQEKLFSGIFGANMSVNLVNDGPLTFQLEFSS